VLVYHAHIKGELINIMVSQEFLIAFHTVTSCLVSDAQHTMAVIAGLVLPFWKAIRSQNVNNMKAVRVSIGGQRIVGINIFPRSISAVKALVTQGIPQSKRIEQRLDSIPECAFMAAIGKPLVKHDCLSMKGIESVHIRKDPAWTPDLLVFARCFEIPVLNECGRVDSLLHEVSWNGGPKLHLNGQHVNFGLGKHAIAPLVLDRGLLDNPENELKIVSQNKRFFVLIQVGRKRSLSEVVCQLLCVHIV
jgi:hypothetical protein